MRFPLAAILFAAMLSSAAAHEWTTPRTLKIVPAKPGDAVVLTLSGTVQHPASFTLAQLAALPAIDVKVDQKTDKGTFTGTFHGVLLWTLVNDAGLVTPAKPRNAILRHVFFVTSGADGYSTAISIGEVHPALGNDQVIVALTKDGAPLASPQLIVPGDAHAAREVHGVANIDVK